MDGILSFFSDLILFTAGLVVALFWLLLILIAIDEALDLLPGRKTENEEEFDV